MKKQTTVLTLILLLALSAPILADDHETEMPPGYEGSFIRDFERVSGKLVDLANAIPADTYGWRPTEEVRSVSEAFVHAAGANFFLSQSLGVPMPEGFGMDAEQKITTKDDVIKTLEDSIKHVELALHKNAGSDLDEEVDFFGGKRAKRDVFMVLSGHSHEHLGQLIAYARSNGVVPPWGQPGDDAGDG